MSIVREHLPRLQDAVTELGRLLQGTPNDVTVGAVWRQIDVVKEELKQLAPNHPEILRHR